MRQRFVPVVVAAVLGAVGWGAAPASAATSVAYVADGSVWLSTLDGAQKVRLAEPVVRGDGVVERYLDVAMADNGRILAVRNEPGKTARLSSYRVWEPDGTSTIQGPLTAPSGFFIYVYPLSLDLSADGTFVSYGYSNSSACCPIQLSEGTYVRNADGNVLDPIDVTSRTWPTFAGQRIVAKSGSFVDVQNASAAPLGPDFTSWFDTAPTGLLLSRTDAAANGRVAAAQLEQRVNGDTVARRIAVLGTASLGGALTGTPDCFLPTAGLATEPSLSQDATRIAWSDEAGLKIAGTPVSTADPCELTSPPVVIDPAGRHPSIGGADIARFLPPAPPAPPAGGGTGTVGGGGSTATGGGGTTGGGTAAGTGGGSAAPAGLPVTLPVRVTAASLAAAKGLTVRVAVPAAGRVTITGSVPASRLGRRGAAIVVARGTATAKRKGTVSVPVRLTSAARRQARRLRGAKLTLRVVQGTRRTTRVVTLR